MAVQHAVQLAVVAHHVVHGVLHLQQHPLLFSFWDAAKSNSVSGHADSQTLLKATLLTAVPVDPHDGAVLHLKTLLVLDVLLDASPEEALAALTGVDAIVEARGHVATHLTQQHHAVDFRDAALGGCGGAPGLLRAVAPLVAALGRRGDVHHHAHGPAGQRGAGQWRGC